MFDKITSRIQKLCYGLNADFVDPVSLSLGLSLLVVSAAGSRCCRVIPLGKSQMWPPAQEPLANGFVAHFF